MAVTVINGFDNGTGNFTTTTPESFATVPGTYTPNGVVVWVMQNGDGTDHISGVTYGGVAMTRIAEVLKTTGEAAGLYLYFLGSGIPANQQTISVTHDGNAVVKRAFGITLDAAADTEIEVWQELSSDSTANPQLAVDSGSNDAKRVFALFSGHQQLSNLTLIAGMTIGNTKDLGAQVQTSGYETSTSTGSTTVGYTAVAEDAVMIAAAVQENLGEDIVRIISPN